MIALTSNRLENSKIDGSSCLTLALVGLVLPDVLMSSVRLALLVPGISEWRQDPGWASPGAEAISEMVWSRVEFRPSGAEALV